MREERVEQQVGVVELAAELLAATRCSHGPLEVALVGVGVDQDREGLLLASEVAAGGAGGRDLLEGRDVLVAPVAARLEMERQLLALVDEHPVGEVADHSAID